MEQKPKGASLRAPFSAKKSGRSKFNVSADKENRTHAGIEFDSELEMKYYRDVVLPQIQEGNIISCETQKKYILQPSFKHGEQNVLPIEYKADFYIVYKNGEEKVIDIKGFAEPIAKIKRKMFWYLYPKIEFLWIGYSKLDNGWTAYEDIQKGRKIRRQMKKQGKNKEKTE
jgi:hypothetical protein